MAEMLVLWILGLIVIAIAWGGIDRIVAPIKTMRQWLQPPKLSRRLEIIGASLFGVAMLSIMVAATDHGVNNMREWVSLPALLIWVGGLWLIPFQFHAVGHYWPFSLAIAVILVAFWVRNTSHTPTHPPTQAHVQMEVPTQQGQDTPTRVSGLGFLLWIFLIGLTVAVIARYTSTWNEAVYTS